jgi:hypothetical protein
VVGADSKAAQKRVEAGAWLGSDWIINKGLADGDVVILDNLLEIRPGAMVKPQQPGSPGGAPAGAPGGAPAADAKKAG